MMKKILFLTTALITLLLSSCTINDEGEFELTWLFWVILIGFVILVIIGVSNNQKEADKRGITVEQLIEEKKKEIKVKKTYRDRATPAKYASKVSTFPCVKEMEVKGTYYRTIDEKAAARDLEVGDTLILKVEQDNPVDPNAVKVLTLEGVHIGYVQWDIAQFVKDNISHVKSCTVTKVTRHEIPYIHASISFSASECKQQNFIAEELRVSPEDKMRDLTLGIRKDYNYRYICSLVDGTYELPYESIQKARALRQGDKVILKKPLDESEYYPYRLDVYTEDDCMIGFMYGEFIQEQFELFDEICATIVDSPLDTYGHGQLFVKTYLTENMKRVQSTPGISVNITFGYRGPYPQLRKAEDLKRIDPEKALYIALPIAEKEKGITAKFLCCQIYRLRKDYKSEREMILKILERINSIKPDEISRNDFASLKGQYPTMTKRLATVESRLNSNSRKKSNDTLA